MTKKIKEKYKSINRESFKKTLSGFDLPDLSCRPSIPTSDNIAGVALKKQYATQIPAGKTISVAYNKGPYMIVDAKDFKTMGKKV